MGLGTPYPLRDLIVDCPSMVAEQMQADITIVGGQTGVSYELRDEDGNPLPGTTVKVSGDLPRTSP